MVKSIDYAAALKRVFNLFFEPNRALILLVGTFCAIAVSPFTLFILSGPFWLGLRHVAWKMVRGEPTSMDDLWFGLRHAGRAIGIALVLFLGTALGLVMLVVPGLLLSFFTTFTFCVLAERPELTAAEALRESFRLVSRAPGDVLVLWILCIVVYVVLGATGIGVILAAVFDALLTAIIYQSVREKVPAGDAPPFESMNLST